MHIMTDTPISAGICETERAERDPAMQIPLSARRLCIHYRTTVACSQAVFVLRSYAVYSATTFEFIRSGVGCSPHTRRGQQRSDKTKSSLTLPLRETQPRRNRIIQLQPTSARLADCPADSTRERTSQCHSEKCTMKITCTLWRREGGEL